MPAACVRDFATRAEAEDFRAFIANAQGLRAGKTGCWCFPIKPSGWRVFVPDDVGGAGARYALGALQIADSDDIVRSELALRVGDIDRSALTADGTIIKRP